MQDGKTLPEKLPKGLMLRKIDGGSGFHPDGGLAAAVPRRWTRRWHDLKAAAGPRLVFVAAGQEADLQLAVLPDSPRPDAIWVLPGTGLAGDLAGVPSVSTADKSAGDLGATLADTLTTMARAINLQKLGAAVGAGRWMWMSSF